MYQIRFAILIALRISSASYVFCQGEYQDPQRIIGRQLEPLIKARYGQEYEVGHNVFDYLIANSRNDKITDPYGTLRGCVLFSAFKLDESDSMIIGMYRNGSIVWDNFPGSKAHGTNNVLYSSDVNDDGEVDILIPEFDRFLMTREGSGISYLWIISWNGSRGKFINDIHNITGKSTVVTVDDVFDLFDTDGDGVMEIRGLISDVWQKYFPNLNSTTLPNITYGWNGSLYGFWPNVTQVPEDEPLPANRFHATVSCRVEKSNNNFNYLYTVGNHPASKQKIEWIGIEGIEDPSGHYAPSPWTSGTSVIGGRRFSVEFEKARSMIKPGQTLSGFITQSVALPTIAKYYLQGYSGTVCCNTQEQARHNILTNSVRGCTLGTRDTLITFGTLEWCDTLTSYTTQSRSLGWITTQATADKYLAYFNSAQSSLQQSNVASARTTLQQILNSVNVDSSSTLSSEAYALLRYNTEYLLTTLPAAPPAPVSVLALLDTLVAQKHRALAAGWMGDGGFVKELDNHLENAKKHLVKLDSSKCREEVEKVQEKLKKEYEKTLDDTKKNKPRDKRFVTAEAWSLLTPTLEQIIALLPKKK